MMSSLIYRPYQGDSIGCDPGRDGAIALTSDGEIREVYGFAKHTIDLGFNNNLLLLDPEWLNGILSHLRPICKRFVIESPTVTTYGGKMKVQDIVKLHNTYAQITAAAMAIGFEVIHADPQNWQGTHSIQKGAEGTVKDVIKDYFVGQGIKLSGGARDAVLIAQYVHRPVVVVPREVKRSGKDKRFAS